jgi:putative membrane protein
MRRFTFDVLLAGTLAFAPVAFAQQRSDTAPPTTRGTGSPSTPAPVDDTGATRRKPTDPTAPTGTMFPSPTSPTESAPSPTTTPPHIPSPTTPTTTPPTGTSSEKGSDASRPSTPATADADLSVIQKVHQANQKEVEMGKMALEKAQSPRVKAYARKLVADHSAADKQLLAYATKKNIDRSQLEAVTTTETPSAGKPDTAPRKDTAAKTDDAHARLNTATGADFDRDFVSMMVDEHDKAIEMVRTAKDSVTDKRLAKMLTAMLPKLERHRKMAQDLLDKHLKS